jgi:hypothetical protein
MATSTRYVKEHVTQEQDWRWTPHAVGSSVDAQCLRTGFRVSRAAATARTLRLRYLDQPRRHATAVRTPGQTLRICCRGPEREPEQACVGDMVAQLRYTVRVAVTRLSEMHVDR